MTKRQFCVISVLDTTWNDDDCCLNIVIGPKVADATFNSCSPITVFSCHIMFEMSERFGIFGCVMIGMWDVRDVECWGCRMFGTWIWKVWDVRCVRCEVFGMWDLGDVRCGVSAGIWDVSFQNTLNNLVATNLVFLMCIVVKLSSWRRPLNRDLIDNF